MAFEEQPSIPAKHGEQPEQHEHSDIRIRPLMIAGIAFLVFSVLTFAGLVVLFRSYDQSFQQSQRPVSALELDRKGPVAGVPKLQGIPGWEGAEERTPAQEMADMAAANARYMNSFELLPGGKVRLPIEQAMQMAVDRRIFKSAPATQPAQSSVKADEHASR